MLQRAAVKISLKEPRKKLMEMFGFLGNFGTREIHLIHVPPKINAQQQADIEQKLEKISKDAGNFGLNVQTHIRCGHVPVVLNEIAEEKKTDYTALYWLSRSLFRTALFGHIESDILRLSNLPVFIYNPGLFKSTNGLEEVMYATDLKNTDAAVLPYLVDRRFTARRLYILHVGERAPDPDTEEMRRKRVLDSLDRLARACSHAYDSVQPVETIGAPHKQIVKQAALQNVDLIVVGKSEKHDPLSQMVGSTAEILPHRSGRSVFIIPSLCEFSAPENQQGLQ